ncbi:sulfurtransferase [Chitinasiproducens palmae]|uniref:tRNA uridine(34) hydroxylase n=1 Tax=Chitinasiproducens palmae TaxID=1770053 RepID=A0A1H2PUL3_9BURK|nr:sulfurtransferase [Chitinasiproducens palmae]SDV50076.1 UPF0176 protein [Chitinasiproducens palmae]
MSIVNLAGYLFAPIPDTAVLRAPLKARCDALGLRGTILLAGEGINLFVAGRAEDCDALLDFLRNDPLFEGRFAALTVKRSLSDAQPFRRMLVKLKKEIITMKHPAIAPAAGRAPAVAPATLKRWLDQGSDDSGRPVVMLDTRNAFEVDVGTFEGALDWRLDKFSDFPAALAAHRDELTGKTVVSFCTGGIRCEKAGLYMDEIGIDNSYQLDGGILGYFEHVGGAHYRGDCFVFDHRTALDAQLQPASAAQCFACRTVLDAGEQASPLYIHGEQCPHCAPRGPAS